MAGAEILEALLAAPPQEQTRYPPNSRYHGLGARTRTLPDGRQATYLVPRVLPDPRAMTQIGAHVVRPGDRTDTIAARYLGDPLASWRIADANARTIPAALTAEPGRRLRIALPEGG